MFVSLLGNPVVSSSRQEIKLCLGIRRKIFAFCRMTPWEKLVSSFFWRRSFLLHRFRSESVLTRIDLVCYAWTDLGCLYPNWLFFFKVGTLYDSMTFVTIKFLFGFEPNVRFQCSMILFLLKRLLCKMVEIRDHRFPLNISPAVLLSCCRRVLR